MNIVRVLAYSRLILRTWRCVVRVIQHSQTQRSCRVMPDTHSHTSRPLSPHLPTPSHTCPHLPTPSHRWVYTLNPVKTPQGWSYLQVHTLRRLVQVLGHQLLEANQAVLQPLLEELGEKVARQQQLMVRQCISVVVAARTVRLRGWRRT